MGSSNCIEKKPNTQLVEDMLFHFNRLDYSMSVNVNYLHSLLNRYPDNRGDLSEEQGKRFHKDIKTMEVRETNGCQKNNGSQVTRKTGCTYDC